MTGPQCSKTKSGKTRAHTPLVNENQAGAMGLALASRRGKVKVGGLRGPAKQIDQSMTEEELSSHLKEWGTKGK